MKNLKNPAFIYLIINTILMQIIGVIAFNRYNSQGLKQLIIYMDIAVVLSLLFFYITKVLNKKNKIIDFIFVPCIVFFTIYSIWSFRNASPFNIDPIPTIQISTPDVNNPAIKVVTFETYVVNKSKKPVDVKFYFTKEDGTENWYPYYDIIPDLHVTEVYHIEPEKVEHINSEITVKTDDVRLITSHFTDADVRYEIIK
ncbi:hypothetical protein J2Z76_002383 [Sedimentibacter acidaminivorans]|uniref:CARDB domain-containing protein n=1 Tax=Sedimentibacter acidaminivorans TaxID=913099 RepID=A0ABS4GFS8_9FIRM|nr:hypothetical protein [Sedimentibacter acidaminivorans]MBP1926514.1 hypothetical protein [Sedimentibacter acidaminivorans]